MSKTDTNVAVVCLGAYREAQLSLLNDPSHTNGFRLRTGDRQRRWFSHGRRRGTAQLEEETRGTGRNRHAGEDQAAGVTDYGCTRWARKFELVSHTWWRPDAMEDRKRKSQVMKD